MEDLYKHVDRKFLPEELGGDQASYTKFHEELIQRLRNLRPRFNSEASDLDIV